MSREKCDVPVFFDELDCFGDYNRSNPLCAKHCVLRIRCVIEQDQNIRMELFSELVSVDGIIMNDQ